MHKWGYYSNPDAPFNGFLKLPKDWSNEMRTEELLFTVCDQTIQVIKDYLSNPDYEHILFMVEISGDEKHIFTDPEMNSNFGIQGHHDPSRLQPKFQSRFLEQVFDQAGLKRMFSVYETH